MRIGRFEVDGAARIGLFGSDDVRDVTEQVTSFPNALMCPNTIDSTVGDTFDREKIEFLPPVAPTNVVYCAALNYEAHASESNSAVPERPLVFLKLPQTLVGHRRPISYHTDVTSEIDYEAELGAVIGTPAYKVGVDRALEHVAGYTIVNDTSARDLQLHLEAGNDELLDWFSGKVMRHTTPVGPYVVLDEVDDPQRLEIASRVNGETLQDDNTSRMVRSVAELVSFVSTRVKLRPGDIIATGTPEGVGTFQDIQLHHEDEVEVAIEDVGTLTNTVRRTVDE